MRQRELEDKMKRKEVNNYNVMEKEEKGNEKKYV